MIYVLYPSANDNKISCRTIIADRTLDIKTLEISMVQSVDKPKISNEDRVRNFSTKQNKEKRVSAIYKCILFHLCIAFFSGSWQQI